MRVVANESLVRSVGTNALDFRPHTDRCDRDGKLGSDNSAAHGAIYVTLDNVSYENRSVYYVELGFRYEFGGGVGLPCY